MNEIIAAEIANKESPFSPGRPVPTEYFIARINEIDRLERAIKQTLTNRNENIFIVGERGIGKSSLACFIKYLAEKKYNLLGSHIFLGGVKDVETMIRLLFQRLLREVSDPNILESLKTIFTDYIKGVSLFGVGVEFTSDKNELKAIVDNFIPLIRKIVASIEGKKSGIILILDDLNGITNVPEFSHFLKSFVDELATSGNPLPILFVLVGIPERRIDLLKNQPSLSRIYDIVNLNPMSNEESKEFFETMFSKCGISIESAALQSMVTYSGGFPVLMHEVGDAIFWMDSDRNISQEDALSGIFRAGDIIGEKYLGSQVYHEIRSETYRSILRRMGKILPFGENFKRKDIINKFPQKERKNFDNFLRRIKKLGLIVETDHRNEYRFANQLYHLSVFLESLRAEKEKEKS